MSIAAGILGSLGVARLLYASAVLAGAPSPISWSPDGRWICYAAAEPREAASVPADWFFDSGNFEATAAGKGLKPLAAPRPTEARGFRIWATRAAPPQESALLEESEGPLGPPAWRPDGRGVAFVRFVPKERDDALIRGRYEVVVMEGMNRRNVLYAEEDLELDDQGLERLCASTPAWNRDGSSLAVTRPGVTAAVLILDARTGKLRRAVENASDPVWSPNGIRLVVARATARRSSPDALMLVDAPSAPSTPPVRPVLTESEILQPPVWSADGQSILAVYARSQAQPGGRLHSREVRLGRISAVTGEKQREWPLGSDPLPNRDHPPRTSEPRAESPAGPDLLGPGRARVPFVLGSHLDLDPESEDCFYTTDHNGRASIVVNQNLRTDVTHKRFSPLDLSVGIGALAVSPDGRTLAIRFRVDSWSSRLSTPALYDVETGALTIPAVDESVRIEWLSRLVGVTQSLLRTAIPSTAVPGLGVVRRPILLPAPGELDPGDEIGSRIRRLGRIGRAVCESAPSSVGGPESNHNREFVMQATLYFEFLAGNMDAAKAALDVLESSSLTPRRRADLLGVRAQILMEAGDLSGARAIVDYMTRREPAQIRTLEETSVGPAVEAAPNPRRIWGEFLARRHDELKKGQAEQQRLSRTRDRARSADRPAELIEEPNQELPLNIPFIPVDPAARLLVDPR